uniref:DegT/DnrJ/EryC1/StrS family aminotransferase n=1 Tax=Ndongobacter massiliensis TaxID=1871025 RepID=UPI0009315569|nr:DegT/DnrJ/EryC1/StrS family aminotransferase [Ndongobacter massiliensis]
MKISFSPPDITEREIDEVAEALRSGWITTGPRTKELERRLAEFCGASRAVCLNSQTAAAEMCLRLLGVGPGDEVITSAYTYTATASVIEHVGAKIVFADLTPNSFEMDYDAVESLITDRTKVIIPVDIGGVPCDYDRVFSLVEKHKRQFHPNNALQEAFGRIIVLADTAHSLGATISTPENGVVHTGAIADFSAFSFHAVKNFTTAEGGALLWRAHPGLSDEDLYKQLQLLSLHGQNKDALAKTKLGAWEYDILSTAYKCNMTDIQAAIGLVQLDRYPGMLARRRSIIERYDAAFQPLGVWSMPHFTERHASSGHLYIARIPDCDVERRNCLIEAMAKRGIACNVHYKPLPMMTAYKNLGFSISDFPHAYAFYENEITLPLHTKLIDEEVEYIIHNFVEVLQTVA